MKYSLNHVILLLKLVMTTTIWGPGQIGFLIFSMFLIDRNKTCVQFDIANWLSQLHLTDRLWFYQVSSIVRWHGNTQKPNSTRRLDAMNSLHLLACYDNHQVVERGDERRWFQQASQRGVLNYTKTGKSNSFWDHENVESNNISPRTIHLRKPTENTSLFRRLARENSYQRVSYPMANGVVSLY